MAPSAKYHTTGPAAKGDPAQLLQRIARQDRMAFEQLYRLTSAKLFGIVLRITRHGPNAEEVMQDLYLKLWQHAASYDPSRGSAGAWLATMARNLALDHVRARLRLAASTGLADYGQAQFEPPPEPYLRLQEQRHLTECLKQLEAPRDAMIVLAYRDGLTREELAARFQMPVATVKTWLRRGLESLRHCMERHD